MNAEFDAGVCHVGDVREILPTLPSESVQTCVTSPPYWGLRDYGVDGQLGLESTPDEYVAGMVTVFREVRRVLARDGTLWLNMGDSYAAKRSYQVADSKHVDVGNDASASVPPGLKPKDLCGIPWRVAFALQADGWWLRQDIIWSKPNPMPESVTDRCTSAHEYLFLLSREGRYFYDADAIAEAHGSDWITTRRAYEIKGNNDRADKGQPPQSARETRNRRSVWAVPSEPYPDAHFATFPRKLIEPCILAGSRPGDTVLDPFLGSGTTAQVAQDLGRRWVGCELSPEYVEMQKRRTAQQALELT